VALRERQGNRVPLRLLLIDRCMRYRDIIPFDGNAVGIGDAADEVVR
jgi:hypothetical protein